LIKAYELQGLCLGRKPAEIGADTGNALSDCLRWPILCRVHDTVSAPQPRPGAMLRLASILLDLDFIPQQGL
jgi:hypothetical protein